MIDHEDWDDVTRDEIDDDDDVDSDFDEATYLRAFPDIAEAVRRGTLASGLAHFRLAGRTEGRLEKAEYLALSQTHAGPASPQVALDTLTISPSGSTLITGWSDDRFDQLTEVDLETRADSRHNWMAFPRLARGDVERTLETPARHKFGFLLVAAPIGGNAAPPIDPRAANAPVFRFASGAETRLHRVPVVASDADLRDLALAALPTAAAGELDPEVIYSILDQHVGVQIAAINRLIVDQQRSRRLISRTGPSRGRYRGTIVTTLRAGADQIVPRLALTAGGAGAEDYEFVVVVTNADQFEAASRAARVADATLGLSLTLILQPGGDPAGFGEDAAVDAARSDRLIFMDHNVIPRDLDWAAHHTALLDRAPITQTRLFGGMLYRPDGALSHRGYYFDRETSLLTRPNDVPYQANTVRLNRLVQPSRSGPRPGPVVGVPGAFLSIDRRWYETLGGFTRHYSRAAFEDIDLCLRSLKLGFPAWVHPLPMWHFERRPPSRPEPSKGGAILNAWLLHRQWDAMIVPDLIGLNPTLPGGGN
ncbi:MAG: hypothetical protein EXR07_20815 [Acetobacteraceae bacterium]|nr:hypothetical protein [Acetobacteraceae bacterium]